MSNLVRTDLYGFTYGQKIWIGDTIEGVIESRGSIWWDDDRFPHSSCLPVVTQPNSIVSYVHLNLLSDREPPHVHQFVCGCGEVL